MDPSSPDWPVFYQEDGKPDMTGTDIFDLTSKHIFNRDNHEIYIRVHQRVFDKVLDDGAQKIDSGYGLVDEFILDGHTIKNVGIKVRGNTSAANVKRQFKFKFDAEDVFAWRDGQIKTVSFPENDDRRFLGEQGFSVRSSQNDPTRIRELLSGKIFRETAMGDADASRRWRTDGGLVYRAAFATLFVTNGRTVEQGRDDSYPAYRVPYNGMLYDPKGLYVITENIDKTFLQTRFERYPGEKLKGYLFQADYGKAYFTREGYSREGWKCKLVKGKKAKDEDDFEKGDEKMLYLIDFLAGKPSEQEIRDVLDMDSLNAYLAGALLATHWDSLAANRNNDYMFYLPRPLLDSNNEPIVDANGDEVKERRWYMITWDLDNTLWDKTGSGNDVTDPYKNWFSNYIYDPARKDNKETELFEHVFNNSKNEDIRSKYRGVLRDMLGGFYDEREYEEEVDELMDRSSKAIEETRRKVEQAGWMTSWGESNNPQDFNDIKQHARVRRSKVGSQL